MWKHHNFSRAYLRTSVYWLYCSPSSYIPLLLPICYDKYFQWKHISYCYIIWWGKSMSPFSQMHVCAHTQMRPLCEQEKEAQNWAYLCGAKVLYPVAAEAIHTNKHHHLCLVTGLFKVAFTFLYIFKATDYNSYGFVDSSGHSQKLSDHHCQVLWSRTIQWMYCTVFCK